MSSLLKDADLKPASQFSSDKPVLRAPQKDGGVLIAPDWPALTTSVSRNHDLLAKTQWDVQGRSLQLLRKATRQEVLEKATAWTTEVRGSQPSVLDSEFWVVGGHQPELFHPGVWAKNFALSRLAGETGAIPLNLIVDNDLCTKKTVQSLTGTLAAPRFLPIPFDEGSATAPWEEQFLKSAAVATDFPAQVAESMQAWGIEPLAPQMWPTVLQHLKQGKSWGISLAAGRIAQEARWGLNNLELPLSQVCETEGFRWFFSHLVAHQQEILTTYNQIVRDYRAANGIRSSAHPVPDLMIENGWSESPFWVWRDGATQRDRLFVRQLGDEVELRDSQGVFLKLPLGPDRSACCAVEVLRTLPGRGIRLRSRALTTTWFARMFLADTFLHGIGGSHYDAMTDLLIASRTGAMAPQFGTVTATVRLPLSQPQEAPKTDVSQLRWKLNDVIHNPQRYLSGDNGPWQPLLEERAALVEEQSVVESRPRSERLSATQRLRNAQRYRRLLAINRELGGYLQEFVARLRDELREQMGDARSAKLLNSREFSWILFPEQGLKEFFLTRLIPS